MDEGQWDTFRMILREYGYNAADFEVRVADDPTLRVALDPGLPQGNATVTVTRRSNHCSRHYRDVLGEPYWLVLFEREVCGKVFG